MTPTFPVSFYKQKGGGYWLYFSKPKERLPANLWKGLRRWAKVQIMLHIERGFFHARIEITLTLRKDNTCRAYIPKKFIDHRFENGKAQGSWPSPDTLYVDLARQEPSNESKPTSAGKRSRPVKPGADSG